MEFNFLSNVADEMARRKSMNEIKILKTEDIIKSLHKESGATQVPLAVYAQGLSDATMRRIMCPERFFKSRFEDLPDGVKKWVNKFDGSKGLYLFGGVGTGKTYSMWAIAHIFALNGVRVRFRNVVDWLDYMRKQFDDKGNDNDYSEELKTKDILFLDDLGSEKSTDWTTEIIYRLINSRYENIKPTFISTNLSLEDMAKKYGDRAASRIVEMCDIIKISGEDRRTKK